MNERKSADSINRCKYEILSRSRLAKMYKVGVGRVSVDVAPLSRLPDQRDLRVYFRILHNDERHIQKMGIAEYLPLATGGRLNLLMGEMKTAFNGIKEGSMNLENKTLDELLSMEYRSSVEQVQNEIARMYKIQYGIPRQRPFFYDLDPREDVVITDHEPKLPLSFQNGRTLMIKYRIDKIKDKNKEGDDEPREAWISASDLYLGRRR